MLHKYNLVGCWILTFFLVGGKSAGTLDISWSYTALPVLVINSWFLLLGVVNFLTPRSGR